jgi:hypothetical protein
MDIKYLTIRKNIEHISIELMIADHLTKSLPIKKYIKPCGTYKTY